MPRSMWSGSISFGLVNVPVKLYPAVSSKDVRAAIDPSRFASAFLRSESRDLAAALDGLTKAEALAVGRSIPGWSRGRGGRLTRRSPVPSALIV